MASITRLFFDISSLLSFDVSFGSSFYDEDDRSSFL